MRQGSKVVVEEAGGAITGYRADNSIRVKIHPADSASHVLAIIVGTGGDATRINSVFLPGVTLDDAIGVTTDSVIGAPVETIPRRCLD